MKRIGGKKKKEKKLAAPAGEMREEQMGVQKGERVDGKKRRSTRRERRIYLSSSSFFFSVRVINRKLWKKTEKRGHE